MFCAENCGNYSQLCSPAINAARKIQTFEPRYHLRNGGSRLHWNLPPRVARARSARSEREQSMAGVLPSYRALNPWALTAKSVVNHSVRTEPVLTTEEGSRNPDNLSSRKHENEVRKRAASPKLIDVCIWFFFFHRGVFFWCMLWTHDMMRTRGVSC